MSKVIKILQVGRMGDIIVCLPIAKHYFDLGYTIIWPVCSEYISVSDYVKYVNFIDIGSISDTNICDLYNTQKNIVDYDVLDLSIGFGNYELDTNWIGSKLRFDEWKYKIANVPFSKKFNLEITRIPEKENNLVSSIQKNNYIVTHSHGTRGSYNFNIHNAIEISPIEGYSVFDWLKVIELSNHIYCVDSCIANLINQLDIKVNNRSFRPYRPLVVFPPVLKDDWIIL